MQLCQDRIDRGILAQVPAAIATYARPAGSRGRGRAPAATPAASASGSAAAAAPARAGSSASFAGSETALAPERIHQRKPRRLVLHYNPPAAANSAGTRILNQPALSAPRA